MKSLVFVLLLTTAAAQAQPQTPPQPNCPPAIQPLSAEQGHAPARDRGLLWKLQRDGRTSWLYGTLHLGRAAWAVPGPAVKAAFAASDVLALEVDVSDPATAAQMQTAMPASPPLPPSLQARLQERARRACLSEGMLADAHPLLATATLALLEARWEGLDAQFGQETLLAAAARQLGRPVVALETVALQLSALIPQDAAEAIAMTEKTLEQLERDEVRPATRRLARAWEQGNLPDLAAYESWCKCIHNAEDRALFRRLNDERNPALAEGIDALHRQGQRVFAAVGALHMSGPKALPLLLQRLGYRVQRFR